MKLLITDLDNTIYDFVTYFSKSFDSLLEALSNEIEVPIDDLKDEFKSIHVIEKSTEKPYSTLKLPSVHVHFGTDDTEVLKEKLSHVFDAFEERKSETLKIYPGVLDTLNKIKEQGVRVVAHTDSCVDMAESRLKFLGIEHLFEKIYGQKSLTGRTNLSIPHHELEHNQLKPSASALELICKSENVDKKDALVIGDSISKDIGGANLAKISSAHCPYGLQFDTSCWKTLVDITHWSQEDVDRESKIKKSNANATSDYTINAFSELEDVISDIKRLKFVQSHNPANYALGA